MHTCEYKGFDLFGDYGGRVDFFAYSHTHTHTFVMLYHGYPYMVALRVKGGTLESVWHLHYTQIWCTAKIEQIEVGVSFQFLYSCI